MSKRFLCGAVLAQSDLAQHTAVLPFIQTSFPGELASLSESGRRDFAQQVKAGMCGKAGAGITPADILKVELSAGSIVARQAKARRKNKTRTQSAVWRLGPCGVRALFAQGHAS